MSELRDTDINWDDRSCDGVDLALGSATGTTPTDGPVSSEHEITPETNGDDDGAFEQAVSYLAALTAHVYDRCRMFEAARLGVRTVTLDNAVKAARPSNTNGNALQGHALAWPEPEPWPEPVDGQTLLTEIAALIRTYVVLPAALADTVALWILTTWLHSELEISTFLNITSATKRCGKRCWRLGRWPVATGPGPPAGHGGRVRTSTRTWKKMPAHGSNCCPIFEPCSKTRATQRRCPPSRSSTPCMRWRVGRGVNGGEASPSRRAGSRDTDSRSSPRSRHSTVSRLRPAENRPPRPRPVAAPVALRAPTAADS